MIFPTIASDIDCEFFNHTIYLQLSHYRYEQSIYLDKSMVLDAYHFFTVSYIILCRMRQRRNGKQRYETSKTYA